MKDFCPEPPRADFVYDTPEDDDEAPPEAKPGREVGEGYPTGLRLM